MFKLKARQKNIQLITQSNTTEYSFFVDSLRLRQILVNLMGNAIKFTATGSITIRSSFAPESGEEGLLTIQVSDTGIGIAPENHKRVFEPFIHDSLIRGAKMYEGSGLGLTISRRLLEKMNGNIRLDSKLGEGSTFTIELKVKYESAPKLPQISETVATESVDSAPGKPLRMLLVDDVPLNLKVLSAMLKRLHVKCSLAESPEVALNILKNDRNYDMILTDMWMPGLSGEKMAECIRTELKITKIPIIAVTGDSMIPEETLQNFAYVIHKPITLTSLKRMLEIVMADTSRT